MIGETLGSYRVVAKLGEGGMGAVYAGEHVVLGRRVAIKLLLPALSSNQELVARFFNEARATATLDHPGLVQVFDFGHAANGSAFIVMELLNGEPLAKRLARLGRLDYASAAGFGRQAAGAVGAAHAVGIVHRDLKPDNLFLVRDAEVAMGERVKVLDFGIAKLTDAGMTGSMTRTGAVLGTPAYMSPEQCRGAGEVDQRADIYSLGCILFEMVCGRPPFVAAGTGEILGAHIFQPRPSPRMFDPGIPAALEAIIARSLEKDPAARQQSMQQLGGELEAFLGGSRATGPGWIQPSLGYAPTAPGQMGLPQPSMPLAPPMTTFGGAAGQRTTGVSRRRAWMLPVIVGVVCAAGAGVGVAVTRGGGPSNSVASNAGSSIAPTVVTAADPARPTPSPATIAEPSVPPPESPVASQPPPPDPTSAAPAAPAFAPAASPPAQPPQLHIPDSDPLPPPSPDKRVVKHPSPKRASAAVPSVPVEPPSERASTAVRSAPVEPAPEPRPAAVDPIPFATGQIWSGAYICGQGKTDLQLRIMIVRDQLVHAVFEFAHTASGAAGSYTLSGYYDPVNRRLQLSPISWIRQPPGYSMVGLAGSVSSDGATYSGLITNNACTGFSVHR